MQIMWVSGPIGNVRKISITAHKVLIGICFLSFSLVTTGYLLHLIGFKIAIEVRPELARSLGGISTQLEQRGMEIIYRERLAKLQLMLDSTARDIRQVQALKNRFMELATPISLRDKRGIFDDGKGGPLVPTLRAGQDPSQPLSIALDEAIQEFDQIHRLVSSMPQDWNSQLAWLLTLPSGIPINGNFKVSSGFGIRYDPFTGMVARHEGLDFTASSGTHIVVSADGIVTRSGWEGTYGNIVEVTHAEGFLTRYAHASKIHVKEGQLVKRGRWIADVGSTGRSTAPHLHYEVLRFGRVLNPVQVLPLGNS